MTSFQNPSRRTVLAGVGAGAGFIALAACSSDGTTTDSGTSATDQGLLPSGTDLAAVADVPVAGALAVTVDSKPVIVTQPAEGDVRAFDATCTHQGCPVDVGDGELDCPCHGSRFDLETAAVLGGPAPRPLAAISVAVQDGRVVTA